MNNIFKNPMPKRSKNQKFNDKMKQKFNSNNKQPSKSNASTNPDRKLSSTDPNNPHIRSKATIKLLNLYRKKPNMYGKPPFFSVF